MKLTESSLRQLIRQVIREADESDKYTHIGYGKYKQKGKEKDKDAETFKKTDSGKFEPFGGEKSGEKDKPEPKQTKIAADPFADKDSETGKDYTKKFMGTDEPDDGDTSPESYLKSINAKDLESGDFDTEDDEGNYLGSEGYDTEELMYEEPPDLKGINNRTDSKILKQKFIDSKLYMDMIGARIEDMDDDDYDEEDIEREQDEWKKFKGVQNNIVKFLKQKSSGGGMMGATGHRTKGRQGSGMYDAKNYGKENNLVEQIKEEFKQYGFIKKANNWKRAL